MSEDVTNSIQNDTFDNQDDLNHSEILEIGGFKHGVKIGKFKDDNNYVLGNEGDTFQDKLLKMFLIMKTRITKIMWMFCHFQMS